MQLVKHTLLSFALFGIYIFWISPTLNGSMMLFAKQSWRKEFIGSSYTGVTLIDRFMSIYFLIYISIGDTATSPESLQMLALVGGVGVLWMLIAFENFRTKSWDQVAVGMFVLGIPTLLFGSSIALSLYLALSLPPFKQQQNKNIIAINLQIMYEMQAWIMLFLYLPLIALILPAPLALSSSIRLHVILLLNACPILIPTAMVSAWLCHGETYLPLSVQRKSNYPYNLTIIYGAIFHITTILASIAINQDGGSIVDKTVSALGTMFVPRLSWNNPTASSPTQLCTFVFQWENILLPISGVIWSVALYNHECCKRKVKINFPKLALTVLFLSIVTGPYATSARVLAERNKISKLEQRMQKLD